jgi:hypothetical protein
MLVPVAGRRVEIVGVLAADAVKVQAGTQVETMAFWETLIVYAEVEVV